jgi:hypothetical protein
MTGEVRFAVLGFEGGDNLGDDIQSIAAERFLPRVDCLLPREGLDRPPPVEGRVKLILNGWFIHDPRRWPPHPAIEPLFVSFHLRPSAPSRLRRWAPTPEKRILGTHVDYIRARAPVGARDRETEAMLRRHGVDAYYSGCLTLTLQPEGPRGAGPVVACDLAEPLLAELTDRCPDQPLVVSHDERSDTPGAVRRDRAKTLLSLYESAKCVVTSRLHCALPCLAFGTPVLFIPAHSHPGRLQPALDLARSSTAEDFLARRDGFDPESPPPNPERHLPLAEALRRRCEDFVAGG